MNVNSYHDWMKKLIAESQEQKYLYLIARGVKGVQYFYHDCDYWPIGPDADEIQLIWTQMQRRAFRFSTEQEVEEFKADYVTPRKASIIRVQRTPATIFEMME